MHVQGSGWSLALWVLEQISWRYLLVTLCLIKQLQINEHVQSEEGSVLGKANCSPTSKQHTWPHTRVFQFIALHEYVFQSITLMTYLVLLCVQLCISCSHYRPSNDHKKYSFNAFSVPLKFLSFRQEEENGLSISTGYKLRLILCT